VEDRDAVVRSLHRALEGRADVRVAYLFGSRARGDAREDSDADIAVYAPGVDLYALMGTLGMATDIEVQLVKIDDFELPLIDAVLRDGVLVHEGSPGDDARFRMRAITETELFRPLYERMRDAYLARLARSA
jgi:predicted nucleotidyltransferase